jgi:hypothetical protein
MCKTVKVWSRVHFWEFEKLRKAGRRRLAVRSEIDGRKGWGWMDGSGMWQAEAGEVDLANFETECQI